jgi:hypothetical protein
MSAPFTAEDAAHLPLLDVYVYEGREQADCPACGMAGAVDRRAHDLVLFECDAQCGGGSGPYRRMTPGHFATRGVDLSLLRPVRFTLSPVRREGAPQPDGRGGGRRQVDPAGMNRGSAHQGRATR